MTNVTKPYLPPLEEFVGFLEEIWKCEWLTNRGPLVCQFEMGLKEFLEVDNFRFVANGTLALQLALKALDITGEVITTPFSFVATTNALLWEKCTPVFVDIDPCTFNLDAAKIEAAITNRTQAILATHVYGNACDIDAIQSVADRHGLKVIYDAAHCFGTKYKGKSIFAYGDISAVSFHATKLFHTVEGGGVFCGDFEVSECVRKYGNFGYDGSPVSFSCAGINAKNSELHAVMGLCNLKRAEALLARRKEQWLYYKDVLSERFQLLEITNGCLFNYAYFPVVFDSEEVVLNVMSRLAHEGIHIRRYFYPALSKLPYLEQVLLPVVDDIAPRVACLPLFYDLSEAEQRRIMTIASG